MRNGKIYVVMNEGEVAYASTDKESANAYADTQGFEARARVLEEWGNDDPSEDDTVELPDGTEIEVSEILEKLEVAD